MIVSTKSLLLFENSIKSEHSRQMYKFHLDKFLEFTKIKDYDSLVGLDSDAIQMFLENFVIYLKGKNLKAKSIRNYLNGIELFFDVNKKTYTNEYHVRCFQRGLKTIIISFPSL